MLSENVHKKLKQVGFLVIMLLVVSTITYISMSIRTKYFPRENAHPEASVLEEQVTQSEAIAQQVYYEPEPVPENRSNFETIDTNFVMPDGGTAVLGSEDGCNDHNRDGCKSIVIDYQPVCAVAEVSSSIAGDGANPEDTPGGLLISKNATIQI